MIYLDCFKNSGAKPITSEGYVYHGKTEMNMSSIFTKLIQEAGRYCEAYASDLLIDIDNIRNCIELNESETFYLAFRDMGVDHNAFIECRNPMEVEGYHAVYRLEIKFTDDDYYDKKIEATLQKVYYSHSDHEWKKMKGEINNVKN